MTRLGTLALAVGLVAGYGCKGNQPDEEMSATQKVVETSTDFEAKRDIRVRGLEAELSATSLQPQIINAIADNFPLTAASRADVTDKLVTLQTRFDEAKNQLKTLESVSTDRFKNEDDKTRDAFDKLHDARKAAWDAIQGAHRTDRSS